MELEIIKHGKRRQVSSVFDYFMVLYCKRRNLAPMYNNEGWRAWHLLSSGEKQMFSKKYEKWQAENEKKLFNILGKAEPFLKKKAAIDKVNVKSHLKATKDNYNGNQIHSTIDLENTCGNNSNADTDERTNIELTKQENARAEHENYQAGPIINLPEHAPDNMSNVDSESSNQFYAASVIDRDIDESPAPQGEQVAVTNEQLIEPVPPPLTNSRELFETIKSSGTLPELATVQWTNLTLVEKRKYLYALHKLKKEYVSKYEQYLNSLSDRDLFKHYNNKLSN